MIAPTTLPQPFIPLHSEDLRLDAVGGKALNLAKLSVSGFRVPDGFFIPTTCYQDFLRLNNLAPVIKNALQTINHESLDELEAISQHIRNAFSDSVLPNNFSESLEQGWLWLGAQPVAVRSSATAEDLPGLSFAGLQDTLLNIVSPQTLQEAVVTCWSSLWNAAAIGYRSRNNISHQSVSMCVVVQNMIQSTASGVLFTANPLTGKRTEMTIDATFGLGEALVGGHVEPDHYVVGKDLTVRHINLGRKSIAFRSNPQGGLRIQKDLPPQDQAISNNTIRQLVSIGLKIEELYNYPQDIEWALEIQPDVSDDASGLIHILQSRSITTLFPLPEGMQPDPIRGMLGFHTVQGILEPMTPLGRDTITLALTGAGRLFNLNHTLESQTAFYSSAERLWINFTPLLQSPIGHKIFPRIIQAVDPGIAAAARTLAADPRFIPTTHFPRLKTIYRLAGFFLPFLVKVFQTLKNPESSRENAFEAVDTQIKRAKSRQISKGDLWEDFSHRVSELLDASTIFSDFAVPVLVPLLIAGIGPFFGILERFSRQVAASNPDLKHIHLEIARGLQHNVTTEMDLKLWKISQTLAADPKSAQTFKENTAPTLAKMYLAGSLPQAAQKTIKDFLEVYGARGLGEIDLGRARWGDDPTHIMQILISYLKIEDPNMAPDVVFAQGVKTAEEAAKRLMVEVRALPGGRFKVQLIRFALKRYRALGGTREAPKFFAIRMMGLIRQGLLESGNDFFRAGYLNHPDDIFFLKIHELEQVAQIKTFTQEHLDRIKRRQAARHQEMNRTLIPRVLLSDGTAFYSGVEPPEDNPEALIGDPVSPGMVTGLVRIVLDPHKTQLQPGEILVCPGTDPAWTPLFLAAGGLVMEVGGMMTHGSVVAREYGIPAVVGVTRATTRLHTGQRIRVDGSSGKITIIADC